MKKFYLLFTLLFLQLSLNAQQEVDSNEWELVIPLEISDVRPTSGRIVALSRKDFLSMPASFDDPTRLVMKFPGFTNGNDQNNSIIYHGMPDRMNGWMLYGSEILNPNHLVTAGIASDQNSFSAGGVNAFSGQVIGKYEYRPQPEVHTSSNFFAGMSDIKLRDPYKSQLVFNTSLIGLEAGLDLVKNKFHFMFNGRYSTVGLLSDLGVDFGGESIKYHDMTLKMGWNLKAWKIDIYGMKGSNENKKSSIPNATNIIDDTEKELKGELNLAGIHVESENQNGLFESTTNYSHTLNENSITRSFSELFSSRESVLVSNFSAYTFFIGKWDLELNYRFRQTSQFSIREYLHQPGIQLRYAHTPRINFQIGANYTRAPDFTFFSNDFREYVQYSSGLSFISKNYDTKINLKYALNKEAPISANDVILFSIENKSPYAHHLSLSLDYIPSKFTSNLFLHYFDQLYQNPGLPFNYSYLSDLNNIPVVSFGESNSSHAYIYGLSLSLSEKLSPNASLDFNATFIRSKQKLQSNFFTEETREFVEMELPLAVRYSANVIFRQSLKSDRLNFQLAAHLRDGYKEKSILPNFNNNFESFLNDPYSQRLPFYARVDARINYHLNTKSDQIKSFLSLDIQNLTNRKNASYYYFDDIQGELILENQLGILPVLSWRVVIE